ncbi:Hypothetical predicted protein, partial [Paramuricea clavata]
MPMATLLYPNTICLDSPSSNEPRKVTMSDVDLSPKTAIGFTDSDEDSESEVSSTNSTPVMVSLNDELKSVVSSERTPQYWYPREKICQRRTKRSLQFSETKSS